jgi:hypothetical protein
MNKEAQRIAIGEVMGWKRHADGFWYKGEKHPLIRGGRPLPNFCNDLNAMHEAWKFLCKGDDLESESNRVTYGEELDRIASHQQIKTGGSTQYITPNLTAAQRAEAFLKTIGKWIEDPQITTNSNAPKDVGGHNCK